MTTTRPEPDAADASNQDFYDAIAALRAVMLDCEPTQTMVPPCCPNQMPRPNFAQHVALYGESIHRPNGIVECRNCRNLISEHRNYDDAVIAAGELITANRKFKMENQK